jgi:carbon-monoxide dehydrogenase medium subunit
MKPAPFDYVAPTTIQEVVALLQKHDGEAKLLAGGQSLVPLLNMRMARPELLIDLRHVQGLEYLREEADGFAIGAMTTERAVEFSDAVKRRNPLLHAGVCLIGHPQIRNRGTIGGSISHADPSSELAAVSVAQDARMRVTGPAGVREIPASEFFVTYLTTALGSAEVLTEVRYPYMDPAVGWSIQEMARRHGDLALAGAVSLLEADASGRCARARVVLFGMAATPVRAHGAEERLVGSDLGDAVLDDAAGRCKDAIEEPLSNQHASAEYRLHLTQVLAQRTLVEARSRLGGRKR